MVAESARDDGEARATASMRQEAARAVAQVLAICGISVDQQAARSQLTRQVTRDPAVLGSKMLSAVSDGLPAVTIDRIAKTNTPVRELGHSPWRKVDVPREPRGLIPENTSWQQQSPVVNFSELIKPFAGR